MTGTPLRYRSRGGAGRGSDILRRVSQLAELLERIRKLAPITDDDGNTRRVKVAPPASANDREALRAACGGRLPADLADFLALTTGIELGPLEFRPQPERPFGRDPTFLRASDAGNGDGLAIEATANTTRVWWVGHDPWFLVYWAPSIESFLELFIEVATTLTEEQVVWQPRRESVEVDREDDGDPELTAFVSTLPRAAHVHDLRRAQPGTEVPVECLLSLSNTGEIRRQGLLLAFVPDADAPVVPAEERVVGPPALALSKATAGAGEWTAAAGESTTIEVGVASAGGAGKGIYVEVGGPAMASGLVIAETAWVGDGSTKREATFAQRGMVARAEIPDVALRAAYVIDPSAKRQRPMPTIVVRVSVRGGKAGANLLTVRVGPLGADPGRGSALQGKRVVTR